MPICTNCGATQPDGAAFCDECGAMLSDPQVSAPPSQAAQSAPTVAAGSSCPVCGTQPPAGAPFCPNCGASLISPPPPPGPAAAPPPQKYTPPPPPSPSAASSAPTVSAPPPSSAAGPSTCQNCGATLESDSAFCDMCGSPVSASQPPAPPPPPPQQQYVPQKPRVHTPTQAAPQAGASPPRLVIQGTQATLPFPPGKTEVIVGREDPVSNVFPELDLTDHGGDEAGVSRQHARFLLQHGQWQIEDLDSTNFTFVNQEKLTPHQPYPLEDGAELRFGRLRAIFRQ